MIVLGLFIYQGTLSDLVHYGNGDIPPDDPTIDRLFRRIKLTTTLLWLGSFMGVTGFVWVARVRFERYLRDVVEPCLKRGRRGGRVLSTSSVCMSPSTVTTNEDIASTLRSAIWTMKWITLMLSIFLVYSIFSALVILVLGEPNPVYYTTLTVNWWGPTGVGSGVFGIVIFQKVNAGWGVAEVGEGSRWGVEVEDLEEGGEKRGEVEFRLMKGWNGDHSDDSADVQGSVSRKEEQPLTTLYDQAIVITSSRPAIMRTFEYPPGHSSHPPKTQNTQEYSRATTLTSHRTEVIRTKPTQPNIRSDTITTVIHPSSPTPKQA
ncbi:hypothetical protein HDU67_007423 [Dinochytrium kinnereticum]|nr:hypothetical protein HDU67_007423 [Dinochytrium kinnereticum]